MVKLRNDRILDCWHFRHVCKASLANDPTNCYDFENHCVAKANAVIVVTKKIAYLKATTGIDSGREILACYGNEYRMPVQPSPTQL